jgi:hypothetical protein
MRLVGETGELEQTPRRGGPIFGRWLGPRALAATWDATLTKSGHLPQHEGGRAKVAHSFSPGSGRR